MMDCRFVLNACAFIVFLGICAAEKCPPSPPMTQVINYDVIKGHWILAASKPQFDEKCKNLTLTVENGSFELHEVLFMSTDNWKRERNVYEITREANAPYMFLYNKAAEYTVKLFLIEGDYKHYMIIYSCDDSLGAASEAWEIWTRGVQYQPADLPERITSTLSKLNLKPSDFSYRTSSDCIH